MSRLPHAAVLSGLGRNVLILGLVSLLTDVSSEMLYAVVPLFLTAVLHAPMSVVGVIEGAAEATASLLKIVSGWMSDRARRRQPFVLCGYGLSSISKPLMALAGGWPMVLVARLVDRVGKGIRTSPRDALLVASCSPENRGKAFGLHRAMDTTGAVIGPLLSVALLSMLQIGYRGLFVCAFIPAALGVGCIFLMKKEAVCPREPSPSARPAGRVPLSPDLVRFVAVYGVFALGNSSDVFLLLKAKAAGMSANGVLLTYVFYNAVFALASTPAGWLSDLLPRRALLAAGFVVFACVYAGFALTDSRTTILVLFALYGFYAAATECVAKALVADLSSAENRGTAMGLMHATTGLLAFAASTVGGILWARVGPVATFLYGAACALAAATLLGFGAVAKPAR